ncbi:ATP-binding protein [Pantanalinema rosaneae CENA516]|uniref:ATP-binding protein n=1 Tax=Pantanalinema rosaneae TaxID=1620701 RepID=UPI003D6EAC21
MAAASRFRPLSLPSTLVVLFFLQTLGIAGFAVWLSLRNGQIAVNQLAARLCQEISDRTQLKLQSYLATPHQINQMNAEAVQTGELDLTNVRALEQRFWNQVRTFNSVSEIYYGNEQNGGYVLVGRQDNGSLVIEATDHFRQGNYKTYTTNQQGQRQQVMGSVPNYDPRFRPWYISATWARQPTWSQVFTLFEQTDLSISATHPVYSQTGKLQGVFATGLVLSQLSTFLTGLNVSQAGESFIMENSGLLIASSADRQPFLVSHNQQQIQRLSVFGSSSPLIRASAQKLLERFHRFSLINHTQQLSFVSDGQQQYLQVTRLRDQYGLNWLMVVVIPETEFTAQITTNTNLTIALSVIALLVSLLLGSLTIRYMSWQSDKQNLESQVQERTAQLRRALHFEALLQRITEKVRDSLDEDQILQTAVQELAIGLEIDLCDAAIYNLEQQTLTICYEFIRQHHLNSSKHITIPLSNMPEIHQTMLRGELIQFCPLPQVLVSERDPYQKFIVLACPLKTDQQVVGNLWLFKSEPEPYDDQEIRLAHQVANQCAIALRQSRLYQATQAQVNQLEALNRLKDDFLSSVSHELRTPMSNIKMATQMLDIVLKRDSELAQPAAINRYMQILKEECQREINLINDLLDLSRLEANSDPVTWSSLDLAIWLPQLLRPFLERAQVQHQQLQLAIAANLPPFKTETSSLERIFTELLNNACKYTPAGGTITLSATLLTPNLLQIRVSNSGIEIAADQLPKIFDRFYRIPHHDPWKHGGTGLGLALVQRLITRLGATIRAESGSGEVAFILQFPFA